MTAGHNKLSVQIAKLVIPGMKQRERPSAIVNIGGPAATISPSGPLRTISAASKVICHRTNRRVPRIYRQLNFEE